VNPFHCRRGYTILIAAEKRSRAPQAVRARQAERMQKALHQKRAVRDEQSTGMEFPFRMKLNACGGRTIRASDVEL
jgi:hypothetical protein